MRQTERDRRESPGAAVGPAGPSAVPPAALPAAHRKAMRAAAAQIRECYRVLRKTGDNVVGEILRGQGTFYEWDHYPKGDVCDAETHAQYYYHAHPAGLRGGEHGHFHTFLRPKGMPPGIKPAPLPDLAPPADENAALSHLVAISMDPAGHPIRLFVTNRWVTGETWYAAEDVIAMVDRFAIDQARPSWPTNLWIGSMLRLFRPEIEALLRQRDTVLAQWQDRYPGENAYEDRRLEIAAVADISVEARIAEIEAAAQARSGA